MFVAGASFGYEFFVAGVLFSGYGRPVA